MQEQVKKQKSWFKDLATSIKDFDKYEDYAINTTWSSMKYFLILIIIFSIFIYIIYAYKFHVSDEQGIEFFKKNILNLDYEMEQMQIMDIDSIIIENKANVIIPIWIFILYFTSFLVDAVILAALGYIVSIMYRIKIKYKATFNMALHALTLPIVLNLLYIIVNAFTGFYIKYFQIMYTTISYIYMIVAILMIKTDIITRQMELIKIQAEQEKVREEINQNEENNNNDEHKETNKDKEEKNDEKDENEDNNINDSPESLES